MPRRLLVPLFGLLLSACNSAPHAPANNPLLSAPPVMPASIISVPVTVDLDQIRDQVIKRAPSPLVSGSQTQILRVRFNPAGQSADPGTCSITELNCLARRAAGAVAVDYTVPVETVITHQVYLRDLNMRMTGNQFNLVSQVEFAINTELAMTGTVDWVAAKGDLVVTSKGWSMKWIRPCNITAIQLNVEALLDLPGVREQVKAAMDEALASGLRQVNLRSALARRSSGEWPLCNVRCAG